MKAKPNLEAIARVRYRCQSSIEYLNKRGIGVAPLEANFHDLNTLPYEHMGDDRTCRYYERKWDELEKELVSTIKGVLIND